MAPSASRRHLSPITIAVNISILGLSLYSAGWPVMGTCIQLGLPVLVLIVFFAFHLRRVKIFGCACLRLLFLVRFFSMLCMLLCG